MPDWTQTLELRESGARTGFLANNVPLEEQDPALGGPLVAEPAGDGLDDMTKAELLDEAARLGIAIPAGPANKADIVAAIRAG